MRNSLTIATLLFALLPQIAGAAGLPSKTAADVPKKEWLDSMQSLLPTLFCKKSSFFRQCFMLGEDKCLEDALRAAKVCLLKFEGDIPAILQQPQDGAKWGEQVSRCAGGTLELSLTAENKKKKKAAKKCNDSTKWTEN